MDTNHWDYAKQTMVKVWFVVRRQRYLVNVKKRSWFLLIWKANVNCVKETHIPHGSVMSCTPTDHPDFHTLLPVLPCKGHTSPCTHVEGCKSWLLGRLLGWSNSREVDYATGGVWEVLARFVPWLSVRLESIVTALLSSRKKNDAHFAGSACLILKRKTFSSVFL